MTRDDILREAMGTVLDEIPRAAQQARDDERDAIVAWLANKHGWACDDCGFNIADLTDAIERGEHRTQENP